MVTHLVNKMGLLRREAKKHIQEAIACGDNRIEDIAQALFSGD
jgi:hypothetical protein